jgi:hypothetical protein
MQIGSAAGRHFPLSSLIGLDSSLLGERKSLLVAAKSQHFRRFGDHWAKFPCIQGITG